MIHELDFLLFKCKIDHLTQQKIPMKDKTHASDRSSVDKEGKKEAAINRSIRKANYGDLLWVQLHGSSWWPAQVVDDSTVSEIHKSRKRRKGEVLVRLYGSYKYLFVDPISSCLEFEDTLDKYCGSQAAILKESLKQDLHQLKFDASKKKEQKMKGKAGADVSQERMVKKRQNVISKAGTERVPSAGRFSSRELNANSSAKRPKERSLGSVGTKENGSRKRKKEEAQKKSKSNSKKSATEERNNKKERKIEQHNKASATRKEEHDMERKKPKANGTVSVNTVQKKLGKSDAAKISQANKDAGRKKNAKASKQEILSTTLEETAKEPSARQLKVMRFLGLIAPAGSPFFQNRSISNSA